MGAWKAAGQMSLGKAIFCLDSIKYNIDEILILFVSFCYKKLCSVVFSIIDHFS